ncbi:MAG TPA: TIGR00725 family protein [Solirubrobacteraceae bacterium]|nr:TIGR00725 family protein [Solirubrobacteraceae bacterium]
MTPRPPWIAVCGPGDASDAELAIAEDVGAGIAEAGAVLVCGGLGGVMEAACRGARSKLGTTVGFLPGDDRDEANGWVQHAIPTGLGEGRNLLVVRAADAVIAIGGAWGTLSEIALAMKRGTPVIGVGTWELARAGAPVAGIVGAGSAGEAVRAALGAARV